MKVHNRYRFSRIWLSAAAILLGILAGYFVGRESILHAVHGRMDRYSQRILSQDEELAEEVAATLRHANAGSIPVCSDEDIELLRRLTFGSRFIKDVERVAKDQFLCSAISGQHPGPLPGNSPDVTLPNHFRVYQSYPLRISAGDRTEVVGLDNSQVVIGPDVFVDFPQYPIHYAVGIADSERLDDKGLVRKPEQGTVPERGVARLSGVMGVTWIPSAALGANRVLRLDNTLYRSNCSTKFPICAVTHITMPEVRRNYRGLMSVYMSTGGLAGVSCSVALLMAGRKKRSHTNQLKRAILMGKLSVAYQPIVELGSQRIVGAEALARWTDEQGDSIRPETIIALAEAEGFVSEITRFVITRSLDELGEVFASHPNFRLTINLAPSDLTDPRLLLLLDERLHDSPITPANITFELAERATSDREVAVAAIRRLRLRGHSVFIDDFGTGYSNLAYLTELNVDGIKINRSFIATLGTDSVTASIVPQILAVAKAFSLVVVVQGIEREEQAVYFALDDPHMLGQGWFFGQPIPARSLMYLCAEKSE